MRDAIGQSWRLVLRNAMSLRCSRNPAYSQRAFARDIGLAPGRVSEIFAGREGISRKTALAVSRRLELTPLESGRFCDMVEATHGRSNAARLAARTRLALTGVDGEANEISAAHFAAIRDWIHLGIVELARTPEFCWNTTYIARRLGTSPAAVDIALENLVTAGLLKKSPGESYLVTNPVNRIDSTEFAPAVREFHRQIIDRAARAIDEQSGSERELQTLLVSLSADQMQDLRELLRTFVLTVASANKEKTVPQDSVEPGPPAELFALSCQLFRLSQPIDSSLNKCSNTNEIKPHDKSKKRNLHS